MRFHRPSNGRPLNPIHFLDQDNTSFTYLDLCKNKTCNTKNVQTGGSFLHTKFHYHNSKGKNKPIGNAEMEPYNAEKILRF